MTVQHQHRNPGFIHHEHGGTVQNVREIVFGIQDGMVSTLGAITGIAIGSGQMFVVLLSGIAIIAVESISMGIGSYVSSRSEKKLVERMLDEECQEITESPKYEEEELLELFVEDGWSRETAGIMVREASGNKKLMLQEMAYRELNIAPDNVEHPARGGLFMFVAYIIGGGIPLLPYFLLPIATATSISVIITLVGLFVLGAGIGKYTKETWYKTGFHVLFFGTIALVVGYLVGVLADKIPS